MKRKFVFLIAIAMLLSMCICAFCACPAPNNPSNDNQNQNNNNANDSGMKHYEISLNKDNFEDYVECKVTSFPYSSSAYPKRDFYEYKGALTYAYYKDVKVTFYVEYSNDDGLGGKVFYQGNYTIKLNSSGNNSFYTNDEAILKAINCNRYTTTTTKSFTITAVTGTVIFDI